MKKHILMIVLLTLSHISFAETNQNLSVFDLWSDMMANPNKYGNSAMQLERQRQLYEIQRAQYETQRMQYETQRLADCHHAFRDMNNISAEIRKLSPKRKKMKKQQINYYNNLIDRYNYSKNWYYQNCR
ncbi:MAG: hypothetical protein IKI11_10710 [Neisseriaceae bacterium]|nr:hypothetical protein [Neisseriaceae bacterium]